MKKTQVKFSFDITTLFLYTILHVLITLPSIPLLLFSCSVMSDSFAITWTVTHQAPLSMGFPRQDYWNGLPFPSPGDLPNPGIDPASPAVAGGFFTTEPPGSGKNLLFSCILIPPY